MWFLLFSSVDIILTWHILRKGGLEVNPLARVVIEHWDLAGAIAFKFSLVLFVVVIVGCSHFQASRYHVVDEKVKHKRFAQAST